MLKPDPVTLTRILANIIHDRHEEGELVGIAPEADLGYTCKTAFGFLPHQVAGIHTHKTGIGDGVWFRLKDGRVVSADGTEAESDPALYDNVEDESARCVNR